MRVVISPILSIASCATASKSCRGEARLARRFVVQTRDLLTKHLKFKDRVMRIKPTVFEAPKSMWVVMQKRDYKRCIWNGFFPTRFWHWYSIKFPLQACKVWTPCSASCSDACTLWTSSLKFLRIMDGMEIFLYCSNAYYHNPLVKSFAPAMSLRIP